MTAPQIGNYGVTAEDCESRGTSVAGFVVREASPMSSNWRAEDTLHELPEDQRHRRHRRDRHARADARAARRRRDARRHRHGRRQRRRRWSSGRRASAKMEGADWVKAVTCEAPFEWTAASAPQGAGDAGRARRLHRAAVARVGHAAHHRRLRPRDEVEHPAPLHQPRARRAGLSGDDAGRGRARDQAGRHLLQQRPRRSGGARLRRPQRQGRRRVRRAGLRHLPRPPGARDGHGRLDLQAEVRPPRHQPPGQAPRDRARSRSRRRTTASPSTPRRCRTTSRSRT